MLLIDYDFYTKKYGGSSIPESSFLKKANDASSKVNYYTFNRINEDNVNDNIRNTACQVAELLFEQEKLKLKLYSDEKEISNESMGPRSIGYVNKTNLLSNRVLNEEELGKSIYNICYQNLVYTGLMYRGVF